MVALFLLPADISWRLYVSLVGGAFLSPFSLLYHLPSPAQIIRDEEIPIAAASQLPVGIPTKE